MANQAPNDPNDPWIHVVEDVELNFSNEFVRAGLRIDAYHLNNDFRDSYLFIIRYNHQVLQYQEDWGSVGYYGENMGLGIACLSPGARVRVTEFAPITTYNKEIITFTLGESLPHHIKSLPGALKTVSFGCNEVNIMAKPVYGTNGDTIMWNFVLPAVGWVSPGVPANPGMAAKNYLCYTGMVVEVPEGSPIEMKVQPNVAWRFDSPRGIKKKEFVWNQPANVKYSKDRVSVSQ